MNLARIVTKHFVSVGGGKHVVLSSVAGLVGTAFSASYTGSKHALIGYFETLRAEKGAHGVSINIICPGPVESNLDNLLLYEKLDEKVETHRKGKMMSSKRCAELCVAVMANDVKLAWIAEQPFLSLLYINQVSHKYDISKAMIKARDGNEKCK
ncbi:Dehydrogenase/reductase SDR family member 7 [Armadillidium vulgare]|nr:Dehydrogenase/reductase SDR family member 7 [Armadillidium vulgare]